MFADQVEAPTYTSSMSVSSPSRGSASYRRTTWMSDVCSHGPSPSRLARVTGSGLIAAGDMLDKHQ